MRLGLGTVQFGQDYGVSNSSGKTPYSEVERILSLAASRGIRVLDTAPAYGSSEEILGQILSQDYTFSIVTKTPTFHGPRITIRDAEVLESSLLGSLQRLRRSRLYGLLVHDATNLLASGSEALFAKLLDLRKQGLVQKVGFSAYTTAEVRQILARFEVDIVQVPFSVFDQRMQCEGCLSELTRQGVEIHARSVFLQGLLLARPDRLPGYFAPIKKHLERYHQYANDRHLSPIQAALGFVLAVKELDVVLCGVTSSQELTSILSALSSPFNCDGIGRFVVHDPAILNPSHWSL